MSTYITAPAPSRKRKRGPYSYSKCKNCRKDKKKCERAIERPADQPCYRCQEKGLQCSPQEDIRKNDTAPAPAPSLSDNSSVITPELKDPAMQCLHLVNWYHMIPHRTLIKNRFRQAVLDVLAKTMKTAMDGDFKGKALLVSLAKHMESYLDPIGHDGLENVLGWVVQSGSYHRSRLELSRSLWDAGNTFNSIKALSDLLSTGWSQEPFEDPGEVLPLQIIRRYFCFLKRVWDNNRQLWKIHHAQLASLAPQLQNYIEIQWHFRFDGLPSAVFDLILDEEPAYCTSLDGLGNTLLHAAAENGLINRPPYHLLQNVQKLLDRGIDVNQKNHEGQTALHVFCERYSLKDQIPFLKLVIQHKEIDINAQNEDGETALHILCGRRRLGNDSIDVLKLLLKRQDIDVGRKDKNGLIPADRLPRETTANLFEEHPFLQRLFPSSSLNDHPQGTSAAQNGSTYTPLSSVHPGGYAGVGWDAFV